MSEYNAERQSQVRVRILQVARQLITGKIGVIAASRELGHLRHEAEPIVANVLLTFAGIDSETDGLPIGRVRKEWSPEALQRKDQEIAAAEQLYRDSAIGAATELIRLLETSSYYSANFTDTGDLVWARKRSNPVSRPLRDAKTQTSGQ